MPLVVTAIEDVTPEWLTAVLSAAGALQHGAVTAFDVTGGRGNWSANASLALTYSPDARGELPARLFLKMVNVDLDGESFGDSEVQYYTRDYLDVADAPLLRCYSGAFSPELKRYHLLLQDVGVTHIPASQKAPTRAHGLALAGGLAALHARWWGAAGLAEAGVPLHSPDHIRDFVAIAGPGVPYVLNRFTPQLQPHWPELVQDVFARHPEAILRRNTDPDGFTLIHGDAGPGNLLVPREGDTPLYVIDRQPFNWSLTTWLGVYDLAYYLALDWDPAIRRACEVDILRAYHAALEARGVQGYSWQRCWDDYRLCVAMGVYIAVEYCRAGVNERHADDVLSMLSRALTACDDLDCAALW